MVGASDPAKDNKVERMYKPCQSSDWKVHKVAGRPFITIYRIANLLTKIQCDSRLPPKGIETLLDDCVSAFTPFHVTKSCIALSIGKQEARINSLLS